MSTYLLNCLSVSIWQLVEKPTGQQFDRCVLKLGADDVRCLRCIGHIFRPGFLERETPSKDVDKEECLLFVWGSEVAEKGDEVTLTSLSYHVIYIVM